MKKLFFLLLGLVSVTLIISCSKDNELQELTQEPLENSARYYVKYDVLVSSRHTGTMDVTVNTENGTRTFSTSSNHFSETFGPVEKGFNCQVSASVSYSITSATTSIYVCKDGEPFVLKATGSLGASYTIDF